MRRDQSSGGLYTLLAVGPRPRPEHVDEIAAVGINSIINVIGVGHGQESGSTARAAWVV